MTGAAQTLVLPGGTRKAASDTVLAGTDGPRDIPLPPLREDLQISRGGISYSGAPTWVVLDPLRNRFFRITYDMFQILSLWNATPTAGRLIEAVAARFGNTLSGEDIVSIIRMLEHNMLLSQPATGTWRALHARSTQKHSWFMRLIHNYLFFKIPLVRPERFIRATWPAVSLLFSRGFGMLTLAAASIGLYLVSRQWEAFAGTFPYVFSFEGAAVSLVSVILIKCLHELGHAYVAHRYGCRVPSMGIAFMVMVPLLYTDVSDAWKLTSRRARLRIDSAGIMVELAVASYAVLLWAFLPDGVLRSAVFVLAAAGWIMSLIVNLNPFMRFDGYYMFADLLGIENLQPRAFRHMRWRLRETLFRLGDDPPEAFPPRLDAILTIYAVATAIYRIVLYLGIALLVYHFAVKIVGIMLFAVEIGFFIIRPVWMEMKEWWSMRKDILASRRTYWSAGVFVTLIVLAFLPLSTQVSAPAMVLPREFVRLYPQEPGRLQKIVVTRGQTVKAGDILFVIDAPAVEQEMRIVAEEIRLAQRRLARVGANAEDLAARSVLESELAGLSARARGLEERDGQLTVRAPFDGRIRDLSPDIHEGQWLSRADQLAFLSSTAGTVVRGYVGGDEGRRLVRKAGGWFVPDDVSMPRLPITLTALAQSGAREIDIPQLTSHFGGAIAVHPPGGGRRQTLVPVTAEYGVTADVLGTAELPGRSLQGVMVLDATGESLAAAAWRRVVTVVLREAGL
ncbi:biotin/lipoyl-binding protein [Neorhizobium sp. NPDC001467]|uniref:biotin/lipoyl-binding protein n=1 Tax=Neorhizobium sp. NPDC001467 TaxID=3390595 RepID=UPI003D013AF9